MSTRPLIRVRDVMKPHFDLVDGMATVAAALEAMRHIDTKTLIVKPRSENDELGIVVLSDIAREVLAKDRAPDRVNIYEIMVKPAITVHPDMDIRYCARLFDRFDLSRAPVVKDREVLGVVSLTDLVMKGLVPHL
ncbi:MAG: CBS domain-containing protein [Chromatiaceae bacterium]